MKLMLLRHSTTAKEIPEIKNKIMMNNNIIINIMVEFLKVDKKSTN